MLKLCAFIFAEKDQRFPHKAGTHYSSNNNYIWVSCLIKPTSSLGVDKLEIKSCNMQHRRSRKVFITLETSILNKVNVVHPCLKEILNAHTQRRGKKPAIIASSLISFQQFCLHSSAEFLLPPTLLLPFPKSKFSIFAPLLNILCANSNIFSQDF